MRAPRPLLARLYAAQVATSFGDGAVLATATLFFGVLSGFGVGAVGLALGGGALAGLLLSVPIGILADRVGIALTAALLSGLSAVAMVLFALAQSSTVYVVGAVAYGVAQASLMPMRQALAASQVGPDARVRMRAMLHTLLNIGLAFGTLWGAVAIAIGQPAFFVATFIGNAVICVLTGLGYLTMRATEPIAHLPAMESPAFRDARLLALTGVAALLQCTMAFLSVILPIWVATRTAAPEWLAAAVLAMNCVIVIATQLRWATWVESARRARLSAWVAAAGAIGAAVLVGYSGSVTQPTAIVLVLAAGLLITIAEVCGGAAAWFQLTRLSPVGRQGEFQSVYGTSTTIARIVGPALLLPLVIAFGLPAWIALGVLIAGGATALAGMLARPASRSAL